MIIRSTTKMRKLLAEKKLIVAAGAHDALSAKIMEHAGFEVIFLSGFGFEASLLGKPDAGLLTMSEIVTHAKNITAAVNIPTLADAEAGYGGNVNIKRTIEEFERAGVAGVFIEDQAHPVMCGSLKKYKRIVTQEEMLIKLQVALDARTDPDFIICARTDADIVSLDEQIRRANAYAKAGADMVTCLPQSKEDFRAVIQNVKAPLWMYLSQQTAEIDPKELEEMGMRGLIIYPVEPLFAATRAMMDMLEELRATGMCAHYFSKTKPMDYREFFNFIGLNDIVAFDQKYMAKKG
jgi:2-methylisocitrate lyase-like PEP mutase family enzyme